MSTVSTTAQATAHIRQCGANCLFSIPGTYPLLQLVAICADDITSSIRFPLVLAVTYVFTGDEKTPNSFMPLSRFSPLEHGLLGQQWKRACWDNTASRFGVAPKWLYEDNGRCLDQTPECHTSLSEDQSSARGFQQPHKPALTLFLRFDV